MYVIAYTGLYIHVLKFYKPLANACRVVPTRLCELGSGAKKLSPDLLWSISALCNEEACVFASRRQLVSTP